MKMFQIYRSPESDGGGAGVDAPQTQPTNGDGAGKQQGTPELLTQEQFNAALADRLKRDREAQQSKLLQSLGVESLDDATNALAELKKLKESQLSESERLQKQLDEATQAAEKARQDAAAAIAASNERLMKAAVIAEASKSEYGIHEDARADLWLFVDKSKITVNENGDYEGVSEAIKATIEAKPYLKGEAKQTMPGSPQRGLLRGKRPSTNDNGAGTPARPTVRF